jgi:hypothetical protein
MYFSVLLSQILVLQYIFFAIKMGLSIYCTVQYSARGIYSTDPSWPLNTISDWLKIWLNKTEKYILLGNNGNALYIDGKLSIAPTRADLWTRFLIGFQFCWLAIQIIRCLINFQLIKWSAGLALLNDPLNQMT